MVWLYAVGSATGRPWPATTVDRIRKAAELLADLADPVSGRLPNYGSNDGAVLLPLHPCPDPDARPALALALTATRSDRSVGSGPWNELPIWVGLEPPSRDTHPSPVGRSTLRREATPRCWAEIRGWPPVRTGRIIDPPRPISSRSICGGTAST